MLIKGNSQILFGGMGRLSENSVINIKNKSHAITAEIVVPESGAEGVIIAQGGNIGGWRLYAKGGKLKYCYNLLGVQQFYAESAAPIPAGDHQVRMEFAYAGGGLGKGGTVSLFIDGKKVGEGKVGATAPMIFSADDGCDVGEDTGAPVSPDYGPRGNAFSGRVKGVQIAIAEAADEPATPGVAGRSHSHCHGAAMKSIAVAIKGTENWGEAYLASLCGDQRFEQLDGFGNDSACAAPGSAGAFREIERRAAVGILGLQIRAVLGEELHERREASRGRAMERRFVRHRLGARHLAAAADVERRELRRLRRARRRDCAAAR